VDSNVDYSLTTLVTDVHESSDSMVSWRAGVVFKPRQTSSIYFGYGTSFNPAVDAAATGAALSTAETAANNPNPAPSANLRDRDRGTEGNRLSMNAAVFRTEKVNAHTRRATRSCSQAKGVAGSDGRVRQPDRPVDGAGILRT
jgi:outer membrane receptor for monomeric catechols